MFKTLFFAIASVVIIEVSRCQDETLPPEDWATERATNFLLKYGYLAPGNEKNLVSMREATIEMQRVANLEMTGNLDEATLNRMDAPRCGLQDIEVSGGKAKPFTGVSKWKSGLTFKYTIFNSPSNKTDALTVAKIEEIIENVFKFWTKITKGLTITKSPEGENGTLRIAWVPLNHNDKNNFDGVGKVLAHAFYPEDGRIHFDDAEKWGCEGEGIDLKYVFTHEFGHSLGLGHSDNKNAIMYPTYLGYKADLQPAQDDIDGIKSLYP